MILSVILLSMLMILLSTLSVIRHLICGNNQNWLLNLNLIYETLWNGEGSDLLILVLEKLTWFFWTSLTTLALLMWKWMVLLFKKDTFKMAESAFPSKLDQGSYIISTAKTVCKKIGAFVRSMKFLFPEVALYLYRSTIQLCTECCFMSGLFLLAATWNCQISYKKRCVEQLVSHLLPLLNPWFIVEMQPV